MESTLIWATPMVCRKGLSHQLLSSMVFAFIKFLISFDTIERWLRLIAFNPFAMSHLQSINTNLRSLSSFCHSLTLRLFLPLSLNWRSVNLRMMLLWTFFVFVVQFGVLFCGPRRNQRFIAFTLFDSNLTFLQFLFVVTNLSWMLAVPPEKHRSVQMP